MIPRWIPQTEVDGGWLFAGRPQIREQLERDGLRFVCHKVDQDIEIWVQRRWALVARFEHWYWKHAWWLYQLGIRTGFFVNDMGAEYREGRWTLRFWQHIETRGYRRGFRDANRQALSQLAKRDKSEFRRGRLRGFYLGLDFQRRFMLRHLRDLKRDVREVRESLEP